MLKPCPFCGVIPAAVTHYPATNTFSIECFEYECGASQVTVSSTSEADAIAKWNTRMEYDNDTSFVKLVNRITHAHVSEENGKIGEAIGYQRMVISAAHAIADDAARNIERLAGKMATESAAAVRKELADATVSTPKHN